MSDHGMAVDVEQVAIESVLTAIALAVTALVGAYLAQELVLMAGLGQPARVVAISIVFGVIFVSVCVEVAQVLMDDLANDSTQSQLTTDNDYVNVITRHDDGYGLAVWDRKEGVVLCEIDSSGVAYQEVLIESEDVDAVITAVKEYGIRNRHRNGGER